MTVIVDSFALEIHKDNNKWEEIAGILVNDYFEKPDKGFVINKSEEQELNAHKKQSENPYIRLVAMEYDENINVIKSFIAIEFYSWAISNGKVIALADSVRKYSLNEKEYREQRINKKHLTRGAFYYVKNTGGSTSG